MEQRRCIDDHFRRYSTILLLFILLFLLVIPAEAKPGDHPALIPIPQKITWNGKRFMVDNQRNRMVQRITLTLPGVQIHSDEAYILHVNADSLVLLATSEKGLFRGRQTIRQLTYAEKGEHFVAGCDITDWPAFKIRGFMQDVGRNYMSLPLLKEQIGVMSNYKFNVFHFHVTDNPGWRLESKKYPQLTSASSMSRWPGKFYTQEDFLNLVKYCSDRYITLIPEFDIPGHCEAFRKAFALDSMSDPRVKPILSDLIDELCTLVPKDKMPYLHLGTDEVWQKHERPAPDLLSELIKQVKSHGREVIVWRPGQQIDADKTSVTQLWSEKGHPKKDHPYIDSRLNYLNHLDPLAGVAQLYFNRICNLSQGDSLALGGILCCWNDNKVTGEYDILRHNPVYPGMVTYSEAAWRGEQRDVGEEYLAKLPTPENPLYREFQNFEERLIRHRDLYFTGKPFPYVRQSQIAWKIIGPFDNHGNPNQAYAVEKSIEKCYTEEGSTYFWSDPRYGGTIHIRHFFGYPSYYAEKQGTVYALTNIWSPKDQQVGCWIGFHDWSRSGGRRGGPLPVQGEWHKTIPKVWVNGETIKPPLWKHPAMAEKTEEIPFEDENYAFREPTEIRLKKGWNQVLLKVPQDGKSWKWMFTFVPVTIEKGGIHEVAGLKYTPNHKINPHPKR
jgi:hypothetical protein